MRYSIFSVQDHYPDAARDVPTLYDQVLAQGELAERLGYDAFFVAEHHFHEYGVVPNPAVMLAALSQRTTRLRLGSAISILTFHDPLTVAENYAIVDALSKGRLAFGVGSGYLKHEFEGYRVDPAEKRERFDEALEVVRRALSGERVTFRGKHHVVEGVRLNVPPVQKPTPPIYVAILRREAAYHVGRQGNRMICVPYASLDRFEEIGDLVAEHRQGRAEAGIEASVEAGDDQLVALHCHVAETDEAARARAEEPFDLYVRTRLYARRQTYDDVLASGLHLFGSVDTVVDKMVRLHEMGVRHVLTLQNFGLLPQDVVEDSMRRFAEEVMPRLAARLATRAAA
jgi:alkanesulfonate monooxygenase SsuD/methylene tetrahydromethanopterin reductase-like flavin-dependent oxidoreductase (luciferase family)